MMTQKLKKSYIDFTPIERIYIVLNIDYRRYDELGGQLTFLKKLTRSQLNWVEYLCEEKAKLLFSSFSISIAKFDDFYMSKYQEGDETYKLEFETLWYGDD